MSARIVVKKRGLDACVKMHKAAARHIWRAAACLSCSLQKSAAYSTLASLFEGGVFAASPRRRWEWTRDAENSLSLAYARQLPLRRAPRTMEQYPCLPLRGRCLRDAVAQTVGVDKGRRELPQSRLRSPAPFVRAPRAVTEGAEEQKRYPRATARGRVCKVGIQLCVGQSPASHPPPPCGRRRAPCLQAVRCHRLHHLASLPISV